MNHVARNGVIELMKIKSILGFFVVVVHRKSQFIVKNKAFE